MYTLRERERHKQKYYDYLQSDSWKLKRQRVLWRDDFCCQFCSVVLTSEHLHVHHKTYDRIFKERLSDLLTLCEDCHRDEHGK